MKLIIVSYIISFITLKSNVVLSQNNSQNNSSQPTGSQSCSGQNITIPSTFKCTPFKFIATRAVADKAIPSISATGQSVLVPKYSPGTKR